MQTANTVSLASYFYFFCFLIRQVNPQRTERASGGPQEVAVLPLRDLRYQGNGNWEGKLGQKCRQCSRAEATPTDAEAAGSGQTPTLPPPPTGASPFFKNHPRYNTNCLNKIFKFT